MLIPMSLRFLLLPILVLLSACAGRVLRAEATSAPTGTLALSDGLEVHQLSERVWLHVSSKALPKYGRVLSNGLVVFGPDGAVLVDTPWTSEQTKTLIAWIEGAQESELTEVIVTHSHEDRTGGVAALPVTSRIHALPETVRRSAEHGRVFTAEPLPVESSQLLAGVRIDTWFPGAGHAPDNVVAWLPEERLLFGGCFLKSRGAADLGNVEDADLTSWRAAVARVQARHPEVNLVVPGHGELGGAEVLAHTASLIEEAIGKGGHTGPRPSSALSASARDGIHALRRNAGGAAGRVVLARRGSVRLSPDGAAFGISPADEKVEPILVERVGEGEPVRILAENGWFKVLLYVDAADFGVATVRSVKLHLRPEGPPPEDGLELGPGVLFESLEANDGWTRVALRDPFDWSSNRNFIGTLHTFAGWVPNDALGWNVRGEGLEEHPTEEVALIAEGARLRESPGGKVLATFPSLKDPEKSMRWHAVPLGETRQGAHRVEYWEPCLHNLRLTGWVEKKDVAIFTQEPGGGGCGRGGWNFAWGSAELLPRVELEEGRWLLDRPDGEVLAVTTYKTRVAQGEGATVYIPTAWGPIPAVLAPEGWEPDEGANSNR